MTFKKPTHYKKINLKQSSVEQQVTQFGNFKKNIPELTKQEIFCFQNWLHNFIYITSKAYVTKYDTYPQDLKRFRVQHNRAYYVVLVILRLLKFFTGDIEFNEGFFVKFNKQTVKRFERISMGKGPIYYPIHYKIFTTACDKHLVKNNDLSSPFANLQIWAIRLEAHGLVRSQKAPSFVIIKTAKIKKPKTKKNNK
jgi:hypothetical protein